MDVPRFEIPLSNLELIIPAIAAGALLPGFLFFLYLGIRTGDRLYRSVAAVTGIGLFFAFGELSVVYTGGVSHDFATAAQIYRLQQVVVTWLIFVLPLFLQALLAARGLARRVNRGITIAGFLFSLAITVVAFVAPDLFRSVTEPHPDALIVESSFGRGAAGPLYQLRDVVFFLTIGYLGVRAVAYILAPGRRRYMIIILAGLILGMLFGAGELVSSLLGRSLGPFAGFTYPRAVVGMFIFLFFAMLATMTRYVDLAQAMETAHTRLQENERALSYMAYFDALTGVRNRKALYEEARRSLTLHDRTVEPREVAVLYVDLDRFKEINDSYGHHIGDMVLRDVAERFQQHLRESDEIYRVGGDEFLVLLPSLKNPADAGLVAQKLIDALSEPVRVESFVFYVGTCVGISVYPGDGEGVETLVKNADRALYEAKKQRNTYRFFDGAMQQTSIRNVRIISGLRRAVADRQLSLEFQPIFQGDGRMAGAEALLRWDHPEWGSIPPATFVPLAEGSGLIGELGRWAIEEAVSTVREIEEHGARTQLSVNLSTKQLLHPSFIEEILDLFAREGVEPARFCMEITENSLFEDTTTAIARLREAGRQGLRFAIDDFGRGFSALAYLRELPINEVKIDKSFISDLPAETGNAAIVRGVLTIARGMGFDVVAEGIESPEQMDFLRDLGCGYFQGFGLSRPLSREDFVARSTRESGEHESRI